MHRPYGPVQDVCRGYGAGDEARSCRKSPPLGIRNISPTSIWTNRDWRTDGGNIRWTPNGEKGEDVLVYLAAMLLHSGGVVGTDGFEFIHCCEVRVLELYALTAHRLTTHVPPPL